MKAVPSITEKMNLTFAGLGETSITFHREGNGAHVHEKILAAFPQLSETGGYEILRSGERSSRELIVIPIPAGGYTVPYLKSTIASAKGYIRPMQKDIPLDLSASSQNQVYLIFVVY